MTSMTRKLPKIVGGLGVLVAAGLGTATVGLGTATPASARVFVSGGPGWVGPGWGPGWGWRHRRHFVWGAPVRPWGWHRRWAGAYAWAGPRPWHPWRRRVWW